MAVVRNCIKCIFCITTVCHKNSCALYEEKSKEIIEKERSDFLLRLLLLRGMLRRLGFILVIRVSGVTNDVTTAAMREISPALLGTTRTDFSVSLSGRF